MKCEACGRQINPTTDAHYQWISGWAKIRKDGGPNAVTKPVREHRFKCSTCLKPEMDGQLSLIE